MPTTSYATGFAVLTAPRSGSTWLIDVLNDSKDATVCTELFLPRKKPRDQRMMTRKTAEYLDRHLRTYPLFCETTPRIPRVRPFSVVTYLNELYRRPGTVGFKCMYSNLLHYPEIWAYIVLRRIHVIHLVRQNHLDVVISDQMRWATRTVHRILGEPEGVPLSIELDPSRLIKRMRRSRRNINLARLFLRICGVPHIEITYEGLVQDPHSFDIVCDFVSINRQQRQPRSRFARLVTGKHSDIIRNYDEVKSALMRTEFASLLD